MARAVVVFDGECGLCNGFVAWLIRHDSRGRFLIAGSAGAVGQAVVAAAGLPSEVTRSTLVVWDGAAHIESGAVVAVARRLGLPWSLAAGMVAVPPALRNRVYRWVAARRPRVEADDAACGVPPADLVAAWRSRLASMDDVAAVRARAGT